MRRLDKSRLRLPQVQRVNVWGCGNFECWWPRRIFGNRRAERKGRLELHPWADNRGRRARERRGAIVRQDWQRTISRIRQGTERRRSLCDDRSGLFGAEDAITNWESGRFNLDDVKWGLETLRHHAHILGGDMCGAYSPPAYARRKQRFASEMDHPKLDFPPAEKIRALNQCAFDALVASVNAFIATYRCSGDR